MTFNWVKMVPAQTDTVTNVALKAGKMASNKKPWTKM